MFFVRENDILSDTFILSGASETWKGLEEGTIRFLPASNTAEWRALTNSAFWTSQGQQGTGVAPIPDGVIPPPHMTGVSVGASLWAHSAPPGWDTNFNGKGLQAYHAVELYWLCCGRIRLTEGECITN